MTLKEGMVLYHGSYVAVPEPDLSKCRAGKDFGKGFYLTTDKAQAKRFLKTSVMKAKDERSVRTQWQEGYVSSFRYHEADGINLFWFEQADAVWLHCVVAHRKKGALPGEKKKWSGYDILGGKIANDFTNTVIVAYLDGAYGEAGSGQADQFAISRLEPEKLKDQFCFRTARSLKCLEYLGAERYRV